MPPAAHLFGPGRSAISRGTAMAESLFDDVQPFPSGRRSSGPDHHAGVSDPGAKKLSFSRKSMQPKGNLK